MRAPVGCRDLLPGDLLNARRHHVVLFAGWVDEEQTWLYFFDTGSAPDYWRPGIKQAPVATLMKLGYQPLRYRGMAKPVFKADGRPRDLLTRAEKARAAVVHHPRVDGGG